jgi:2-polyprenyl-3-methyl-5-hydroxy-6-metoxy-1,4-benzoquinol methylase
MGDPTPLPGLPGSADAEASAAYHQRLVHGGNAATRLAHRRRFRTAERLCDGRTYDHAADVGAADGAFLATLVRRGLVDRGVAIDADPAMNDAGQRRHRDLPLVFATPDAEPSLTASGRCDLVVCMETLEHVDDPVVVVDELVRLAAPGARIVVSMPVEVGPMVVAKQLGRWLANRRGTYGYERYSARELAAAAAFRPPAARQNLHSHKGFDYRRVVALLDDRFAAGQATYSPFPRLGRYAASTVFWVGRASG